LGAVSLRFWPLVRLRRQKIRMVHSTH
jgi:hypothetical protein